MIAVSGEGKGRGVKAAALFALAIVVVSGLVGAILLAAPTNTNRFYGGGLSLAAGGDGFSIGSDTVLSRAAANSWTLGAGDTLTIPTLTSGRIPIAGAGGLLGDDADLTWTGGDTLNVANLSTTSLYVNGYQYNATQPYSYEVWINGIYYAKSGSTGIVTSNANFATLMNGLITSTTQGVILLKDGIYTQTASIPMKSYVWIIGESVSGQGVTLGVTINTVGAIKAFDFTGQIYVTVKNIKLVSDGASADWGLYISTCSYLDIERVITTSFNYGVYTAGSNYDLNFYYCRFDLSRTSEFYGATCGHQLTFSKTYFGGVTTFVSGVAIGFRDCWWEKSYTANDLICYITSCDGFSLIGCRFENQAGGGHGVHALEVGNSMGGLIAGNFFNMNSETSNKAISLGDYGSDTHDVTYWPNDYHNCPTTVALGASFKNYQNSGSSAFTIGVPTLAVTHNLDFTPIAGNIQITPTTGLGNCTSYAITAYSSTTFTITLYDATGAVKGSSVAVGFAWAGQIP